MNKIKLDEDEGIILQEDDARYDNDDDSDDDVNIEELYLTNKNIIYVLEYVKGFFSNSTIEIKKIPLKDIKIINDKLMVDMVKSLGGYNLQIQYVDKIEKIDFISSNNQKIAKWVSKLNELVTGDLIDEEEILESVVSSRTGFFRKKNKKSVEKDNNKKQENNNTSENNQEQFCPVCGVKVKKGTKFCPDCGEQLRPNIVIKDGEVLYESHVNEENNNERKQGYAGEVIKCPNCGNVITESMVKCPQCGFQITKRKAVSSIKEFQDQLMDIERTRKKSIFSNFRNSIDPVDAQKLMLIKNFPIPNTIDDIQEFLFLSITNINDRLSRNSRGNQLKKAFYQNNEASIIEKSYSDAWVIKMQQAYQKAEALFPNDQAFEIISKAYNKKMTALNMEV